MSELLTIEERLQLIEQNMGKASAALVDVSTALAGVSLAVTNHVTAVQGILTAQNAQMTELLTTLKNVELALLPLRFLGKNAKMIIALITAIAGILGYKFAWPS